jgi:hypothetical protein
MSRPATSFILGFLVLAVACGTDRSDVSSRMFPSAPAPMEALKGRCAILGDSTMVGKNDSVLRLEAEYKNHALIIESYDQKFNEDISAILAAHGYNPWSAATISSGLDPDCLLDLGKRIDAERGPTTSTWGGIKWILYCQYHPDDPRCKPEG